MGRFGIGVLATFLLGDEAIVTTRPVTNGLGYQFTLTPASGQLEVERVGEVGVGTSIQVQLRPETQNRLFYPLVDLRGNVPHWTEWYFWDDPQVEFLVDEQTQNTLAGTVPRDTDTLTGWRRLTNSRYESCLWRSEPGFISGRILEWTSGPRREFICNGIAVDPEGIDVLRSGLDLGRISISVVDHDSSVELDLARRQVISFLDSVSVLKEACKLHLARLLELDVESPTSSDIMPIEFLQNCWVVRSAVGYTVSDLVFLKHSGVESLIIFGQKVSRFAEKPEAYFNRIAGRTRVTTETGASHYPGVIMAVNVDGENTRYLDLALYVMSQYLERWGSFVAPYINFCRRLWVSEDRFIRTSDHRESATALLAVEPGYFFGVVDANGVTQSGSDRASDIASIPQGLGLNPYITEWFVEIGVPSVFNSDAPVMLQVLREAFGDVGFIPYDKAERRVKLAHAYEYLADYLTEP